MTDHELAELLDPEHKRAGWWRKIIPYSCPHCFRPLHGTHVTPPAEDLVGGYRCMSCRVMHTAESHYTGPPLTTDDLAAFRYARPVLLAAGCSIEECLSGGCDIYAPTVNAGMLTRIGEGAYPAATTAAIAWLRDNQPETLKRAIAQVGVK